MAGGIRDRTTKDMVWSLIPLALVILAFAGLAGMCAFSPGGPEVDDSAVPTVDAPAELRRVAAEVPFAVRVPRVPDGWRANSFGLRPVSETTRAVRVGWLLPGGGYLRLSQSDAAEQDLAALETSSDRPVPVGAVDVDGVTWVHYPSVRDEPAWVTEVSGVRVLVTGSAPEADLRLLAEAVLAATPLPTG
jgi:hypothetical protein